MDRAVYLSAGTSCYYGDGLLGAVIDGDGSQISECIEAQVKDHLLDLNPPPINPMDRMGVEEVMPTGIKAIDGLLSLGFGQRVGLFAGTGVGKSSLLSMLTRFCQADVVVVGLIGERGREVKDFVRHALNDESRRRSIVVASPADDHPSKRIRAARLCTAIAEHYRSKGSKVLLLMDSLTRYAQALREVALAAGEMPSARGFPPSVFYEIPALVERAGALDGGAITAIYTVLAEGDDMNDPIVDAARGVLDGHIVLSRKLATSGIFPAIDISSSLSRVMHDIVPPQQMHQSTKVKSSFGLYDGVREMQMIGALDQKDLHSKKILEHRKKYEDYIAQDMDAKFEYDDIIAKLMGLPVT